MPAPSQPKTDYDQTGQSIAVDPGIVGIPEDFLARALGLTDIYRRVSRQATLTMIARE